MMSDPISCDKLPKLTFEYGWAIIFLLVDLRDFFSDLGSGD